MTVQFLLDWPVFPELVTQFGSGELLRFVRSSGSIWQNFQLIGIRTRLLCRICSLIAIRFIWKVLINMN